MMRIGFAIAAGWLLLGTSAALADPCTGRLPTAGTRFSGVVRYVGDGDGFCVGPAERPDLWIEVRLGDFYAPELDEPGGLEAKRRLRQLAMGQSLTCLAGRQSYDRVIGYCTIRGTPLGDALRAMGGVEGGRGYRR